MRLPTLMAACLMLGACRGDTRPDPQVLSGGCTSLQGRKIGDVTITSARRIEPGAASVVGICQVLATRFPFLDIEIDLPDNWSGRLIQQGGSGFDGRIPSGITRAANGGILSVNAALNRKAAIYAASNGGNRAGIPSQAAPAVWASSTEASKLSAEDWAYQALAATRSFAQALAKEFYGSAPTRTYFIGCSNGGRNAYVVAERWPGEYDGIVAGCETMNTAGQVAAWMSLARTAGTAAAPTAAQYQAAFSAAMKACDGNDGTIDGVMANPAACGFDALTLKCGSPGASSEPSLCLSAEQAETLRSLMSDIKLSDDTLAYAGFGWADFSFFGPAFGVLGGGFAVLATNDASWLTPQKQATFDLNRDYPPLRTALREKGADHDKDAIAAYVASGRKLISWHGGLDNLISLNEHVRNYAAMIRLAEAKGLADPRANARFFVVPGAAHGAGSRFEEVDWLSAIIDWVEQGVEPTHLVYRRKVGDTTKSMPVCEYPDYPRYNGTGGPASASSFTCTPP